MLASDLPPLHLSHRGAHIESFVSESRLPTRLDSARHTLPVFLSGRKWPFVNTRVPETSSLSLAHSLSVCLSRRVFDVVTRTTSTRAASPFHTDGRERADQTRTATPTVRWRETTEVRSSSQRRESSLYRPLPAAAAVERQGGVNREKRTGRGQPRSHHRTSLGVVDRGGLCTLRGKKKREKKRTGFPVPRGEVRRDRMNGPFLWGNCGG